MWDDMAQPTFSTTTERVYSQLPDVYRETDATHGYQFKQYVASVVDQLGDVDLLIARFRYLAQIDREMAKRYAQRFTTYTHVDRVNVAQVDDNVLTSNRPVLGFLVYEQRFDVGLLPARLHEESIAHLQRSGFDPARDRDGTLRGAENLGNAHPERLG